MVMPTIDLPSLSPDQVSALLQQGKITPDQAQALGGGSGAGGGDGASGGGAGSGAGGAPADSTPNPNPIATTPISSPFAPTRANLPPVASPFAPTRENVEEASKPEVNPQTGYIPGSQADQAAAIRNENAGIGMGGAGPGGNVVYDGSGDRRAFEGTTGGPSHYPADRPNIPFEGAGGPAVSGPPAPGAPIAPIKPSVPVKKPGGGGGSGIGGGLSNPFAVGGAIDLSNKRVMAGDESIKGALDSARTASQDKYFGTMTAHQNYLDEIGGIEAERSRMQDAATKSAQQRDNEVKAQVAQLQASKIDPDHWWNERSTGQKIAATLGMALGAFGSSMPHTSGGGKNYAWDMIQKHIDGDISAQEKNLTNKWNGLTKGMELNKSEDARNQFMVDQKQRLKLDALEKFKSTLGVYDAETTDAESQVKIEQLRQQAVKEQEGIFQQGEKDRFSWLQKAAAGQAAANAAAHDPLAGIPPKERTEAMKEFKSAQDYANATAALDDAKKKGDRREMELATSRLLGLGGVKGKENIDSAKQVGSFARELPFTDSAADRANQVTAGVSAPSTPTLDRYGIRPQTNRPGGGGAGVPGGISGVTPRQ